MNGSLVLILDKRVEISIKYKKILEQNCIAQVLVSSNEEEFFHNLTKYEPDLLLISDNTYKNLPNVCTKIRQYKLEFRPVVIVLSKSSFEEDKINALEAGADDFLSEPIKQEEFAARINAHLRRSAEETSNNLTNLPNKNFSKKIIRRCINSSKDWAMLLLGIDNFSSYKEIYGEIPSARLLQAYTAIIKASIEFDDYVGHLNSDNFLIITSAFKAEKLADYLNYAFDSIFKKFYSKSDMEKGYILLHGESKAGCKIPLMTSSIGIINSELMSYYDEIEATTALIKVQKLAKLITGSSKVIDRPLLCSDGSCIFVDNKNIVIIEQDNDLAYLLETTLKIQGFNPIIIQDYDLDTDKILNYNPSFLLIDGGENLENTLNIGKKIKQHPNNIKIIFTDTKHEKEKILSSGVDLYMPKPYDLMELFQWIYKLID